MLKKKKKNTQTLFASHAAEEKKFFFPVFLIVFRKINANYIADRDVVSSHEFLHSTGTAAFHGSRFTETGTMVG